jgi:quinoprotein glucose dehydrogenase
LAGQYGLRDFGGMLFELVASTNAEPLVRIEALRALALLQDAKLAEAVQIAFGDSNAPLRKEATTLQSRLKPSDAAAKLAEVLEKGTPGEKQNALMNLGTLKDHAADELLGKWLDQLIAGKVPMELQLDLLEAAAKRSAREVKDKLARFNSARSTGDELVQWRECLAGGNAAEGKKIFFERAEASCTRCHKIHGEGGEVGPILDGIGTRQSREYLLESILLPNKQIAAGFETLIVSLKNGTSYAGIVKSESKKELVINSPEDGIVKVDIKDIDKRTTGMSGMPPNFGEILSKQDIRNLVEYLSSIHQ